MLLDASSILPTNLTLTHVNFQHILWQSVERKDKKKLSADLIWAWTFPICNIMFQLEYLKYIMKSKVKEVFNTLITNEAKLKFFVAKCRLFIFAANCLKPTPELHQSYIPLFLVKIVTNWYFLEQYSKFLVYFVLKWVILEKIDFL